ncbi:RNA-directed DNA polymerase from mobile element jockey [Elysia marginata]|uniref:RNA-directed DNA polymerase from mobile element jockey n=1 Tax=Elysia marginata TaxID=1093978 RepID=A0AAV4IWB7_9GAST|nr:RNA-directed DNA polymerase from mobile element jockey [Elysia marginata]
MDTQPKTFAESVRNQKRPCSQTPAKRRATDFYEAFAGTKKFINVESLGEGKITDISPFQIYDELEGVLGRDPHISTTNRGLLIEVRDENLEKKLLSLKTMAGVPVWASPDRFLNTSKGVVSHKDLWKCKEEEFLKICPGVTFAKHIKKRRGKEMIPTYTFILTFDSPTPPTQVKAGYVKLNVRPYVPTPMRCYKCHKFGHGREKCRGQDPICGKCGKVGHAADSCKNDPHCVNCRGDHAASDRVCPKYAEEH